MEGKRGNNEEVGISVPVNARVYRELRMEARRRGCDLSEMVRMCLDEGVRSLKGEGSRVNKG